jgi:hypothetical protein
MRDAGISLRVVASNIFSPFGPKENRLCAVYIRETQKKAPVMLNTIGESAYVLKEKKTLHDE